MGTGWFLSLCWHLEFRPDQSTGALSPMAHDQDDAIASVELALAADCLAKHCGGGHFGPRVCREGRGGIPSGIVSPRWW
jgi:hypothetical protein